MLWYLALSWGLFGGAAVEAMDFYRASKEANETPLTGRYILKRAFAVALRIAVGGGLAVAFAEGNQISGAMGALMIGAAAPLIVAKFAKEAPRF